MGRISLPVPDHGSGVCRWGLCALIQHKLRWVAQACSWLPAVIATFQPARLLHMQIIWEGWRGITANTHFLSVSFSQGRTCFSRRKRTESGLNKMSVSDFSLPHLSTPFLSFFSTSWFHIFPRAHHSDGCSKSLCYTPLFCHQLSYCKITQLFPP